MNQSKAFFNLSIEELYAMFNSNQNGLNDKTITSNQEKYGENSLEEKKTKSKARVFLEQFQDILVIILIIAAIISIFTDGLESTIVIFAVILLNAFLGTFQFFKAQKSLKALKNLSSPTATVIRNNQQLQIKASNVVVGDIVLLTYGDIVPADIRIIDYTNFEVDESSLTGEAIAVEKNSDIIYGNISLADVKNMAFSGTQVTNGKAKGIVVAVGKNTELGKIASLLNQTTDEKTPLEHSLDNFSKKLAIVIMLICIFVFIFNLYKKVTLLDSLMFAVSLAVAAIPEALCCIVTIVLALGTQKMASMQALVKELKAVEALGCVNVICSDKTGTITENKMAVKTIYSNGEITFNEIGRIFLDCLALCNSSNKKDNIITVDDAIINYLIENKFDYKNFRLNNKIISEIPFDSKRKLMSVCSNIDGLKMYTKGAAEVVVSKCITILEQGKIKTINHQEILNRISLLAKNGERVLGFAFKSIGKQKISAYDEDNLCFLGLVGFIDPPKKEVANSISLAKRAGIIPVMITGDHLQTALSIANDVGINDAEYIEGYQIDQMSEHELIDNIERYRIYARVSPENKIRIVKAWQAKGQNVAFVGDGINDSPAIKQANVGISMGISGTEVSKDSSSIILLDDNYSTIVNAVKNGRAIYNNIQNAICFLMSGNAAGIFAVIYTCLFGLAVPFAPVHLLFINLLTDSLPAIGIGMEEASNNVMNKKPRKMHESIMNKRVFGKTIIYGILLAFVTIWAFVLGNKQSIYYGRTMAFSVLCMGRLFHSFNCLSNFHIIKNRKVNSMFKVAFSLGMILIMLALFFEPLSRILSVEKLNKIQIIIVFTLAIFPTLLIQSYKVLKNLVK